MKKMVFLLKNMEENFFRVISGITHSTPSVLSVFYGCYFIYAEHTASEQYSTVNPQKSQVNAADQQPYHSRS